MRCVQWGRKVRQRLDPWDPGGAGGKKLGRVTFWKDHSGCSMENRQEARVATVRPVMRTFKYPGRSWGWFALAGFGDGEKQMALRDTLGDKMKGLEYAFYPLFLCLLANAYAFFWGQLLSSQGVFPWYSRRGYAQSQYMSVELTW